MRLTSKLALAATLGIALLLATYSSLRLRRDASLYDEDMQRDHGALAQALALGATVVSRRSGPDDAVAYIAEAREQRNHVSIRWVEDPRARLEAAPDTYSSTPTFRTRALDDGSEELITQVPAVLGGSRAGYVEIRESLENRAAYLRDTQRRHVAITLVLIVFSGAILLGGGWVMLGRPLRPLLAKIKRIGEGDWSGPLGLRQTDELGTIAREIDAMCERLSELRLRGDREAEARITAMEQLRHAERLVTVGKLASGIAHELGTPLNVIAASARLIERGASTGQDAQQDARVIVEQTARMTRIIRQLLDFARTRPPRRTLEDLGALVRAAVTLLEPLAAESGISVSVHEDGSIKAPVDPGQVHQVVTNLLVNALQAQPNGGAVRLSIGSATAASLDGGAAAHAVIAVEDDGPGIAPELRERIFEPFFTTKDVGEGTGLGLSVAYGIVREHGGFFEVGAPQRGSRFEVHLPMGGA